MKFRTMLVTLFVLVAVVSADAQIIKLASIAPENSPFGRVLNRFAADVQRITNGRVRLRIYHNGVQGDEQDIIRKIRIGQLQAGLFSSSGLDYVSRDFLAYSMPFLIRTDAELEYVLDQTRPFMEEKLLESGMRVLALAPAGWLRFFARDPVVVPQDLRDQRLAANPTQEAMIQVFKLLGYNPIPINLTETLSALNSGLIDAFYTSPIVAAGYQWFALAPHMPEFRVSPYLGSLVISERAWQRVPDQHRQEIEEAAKEAEEQMKADLFALEEEAIATMVEFGLEITDVPDSAYDRWIADFEKNFELSVGTVYSEEVFALIQRHLADFRN
jgi:TRAP-type C4-dicarboxylate transport system substrate-binding protein